MESNKNNQQLIKEAQLKDWTGFKQQKPLIDFLIENNIPFARGKGGEIITTINQIDTTLSGKKKEEWDW
ncbi:hypothetical protein NX722_28645 [Endozoicomonas gorgoniicola]|uniref:DUF4224 domain-containing protein n=1 Tax=Endozoicomonas gorgoniicola TaxID=1234144 RepID=A0ABT3N4G9_9GAMM|nr:hypothetical protein [Endozoicomonas gorgoniicola]MCW7556442.1 hypothetical protein [Endozoicomonas gorgoniicola]MCW7556537.1 hypothetical protein [Endozoicomonas gorgoniicola]